MSLKNQLFDLRENVKRIYAALPIGVKVRLREKKEREINHKVAMETIEHNGFGNLPDDEKKKLEADMFDCFEKHHFNFAEYFSFGCKDKTEEERAEFIGDYDRYWITVKINKWYNNRIFDVKSEAAKTFAAYYKRETISSIVPTYSQELVEFLKKHKKMIVKPIAGSLGSEIKILTLEEGQDAKEIVGEFVKEFCARAKRPRKVFVEEVIEQDPRIAKFHPQSLNTLRLTTIRLNDRTVIFHPTFRTGAGNAIVDNAGAGGILSAVDAETGEILAAGNKACDMFTHHPDTNEQLVGFKIPEFDEAVRIAKELAQIVPSNRYTGWDLALSTKGWVLVEANCRGQWGAQLMLKQGFRKEIEGYLKELGVHVDIK